MQLLLILLLMLFGVTVFGVYWLGIRCPHDAELGCAQVCDDAATSMAVRLIHHEMPGFVELESRYVKVQNQLGLRTSVTGRRLVSSHVCPSGVSLATPFLAALSPKVQTMVECQWDCRTVLRAEEPFHIAGPRPGTAGPFEGTLDAARMHKKKQQPATEDVEDAAAPQWRFCPEYKSYVVQLAATAAPHGSVNGTAAAVAEQPSTPQLPSMQTVHRLEELADIFAPISSAEEALSFAAAATWGEPSFQTQLLPWSEYVVDQLEDTHVEVVVRKARPLKSGTVETAAGLSGNNVVPPLSSTTSTAPREEPLTLYFLVNLYSREGGPCPGRGRLWEHRIKVFPNATIVEQVLLVAKPCHSQTCAEHDPLTAPLPPVPKLVVDPMQSYRRGDPPRRQPL